MKSLMQLAAERFSTMAEDAAEYRGAEAAPLALSGQMHRPLFLVS